MDKDLSMSPIIQKQQPPILNRGPIICFNYFASTYLKCLAETLEFVQVLIYGLALILWELYFFEDHYWAHATAMLGPW